MRKSFIRLILISLALAVALTAGCSSSTRNPEEKFVTVVVESSPDYYCAESVVRAKKNSDVTVRLTAGANDTFGGVDYADYEFTQSVSGNQQLIDLTLHRVRYSTVISPEIKRGVTSPEGAAAYYSNDGTDEVQYSAMSDAHLRFNTRAADRKFIREGFVQTGWNTQADGKGTHIGFGSRYDKGENIALYAEWEKACAEENFVYTLKDNRATVVKYTGTDKDLVIPRTLGGCRVANISSGAVTDRSFGKIVLPDTVARIMPRAFERVTAEEIYLFDTPSFVAHDSFESCTFTTLHINAARAPYYSGTYFDAFTDKCDRLISIADEKKIILAAGSSTRFGFDSALLDAEFEDYEIVNMGVFAYANMLPEYMIISSYAKAGDILVSTPEFDTVETQFCTTTDIDYAIFAMVESNYDLFARIDCKLITNVIPAFADHIARRYGTSLSYDISAYDFDEDGNPCEEPSYNKYGDYVVPRPNNEELKLFGTRRACYNKKYFPEEYIESLNDAYALFTEKGVTVLFEYSPRSRTSITDDSDYLTAAELGLYLENQLTVPVIGQIEDSLMSAYYFFGTDNHLSDDGVQIYTKRVTEEIKKYLYTHPERN